jgi:hypothetical protein
MGSTSYLWLRSVWLCSVWLRCALAGYCAENALNRLGLERTESFTFWPGQGDNLDKNLDTVMVAIASTIISLLGWRVVW